jgi:hypothetical protein
MKSTGPVSLTLVVVLAGCLPGGSGDKKLPAQAKMILEKATEFELYSLEPDKEKGGWNVLGKTTVKDAKLRKELLAALEKSIAEPGEGGHKCFWPRHQIRATHEGKKVDLVICFECQWVYVYLDGKEKEPDRIEMDGGAQPLFDKVLSDAGVPLPKKKK